MRNFSLQPVSSKPGGDCENPHVEHDMAYEPGRGIASGNNAICMSHACAVAVMHYWQHLAAAGQIHGDQPLLLLDLSAQPGEETWRTMRYLQVLHAEAALRLPALRYLVIEHQAGDADALRHPRCEALLNAGDVNLQIFDAGDEISDKARDEAAKCISVCLEGNCNPVVVIAQEHFSRLPNPLYGWHYGELFEERAGDKTVVWNPIALEDLVDMRTRNLLEGYGASLNSAAVGIPTGAMDCISEIQRCANAPCLFIARDAGVINERDIRLEDFSAQTSAKRKCARSVNFHAIGMRWPVGRLLLEALSYPAAVNMRVAMVGISGVADKAFAERLSVTVMRSLTMEIMDGLVFDAQNVDGIDMLLRALRQSRHDPSLLLAHADAACRQLETLQGAQREAWLAALENTWQQCLPQTTQVPRCFAVLAAGLGDWALARRFLVEAWTWGMQSAEILHEVALCEIELGAIEEAGETLRQLRRQTPRCVQAIALQRELHQRRSEWMRHPLYVRHIARSDDVSIEPLRVSHLPAFWIQYRDPQIGMMTRLPDFPDYAALSAWVDECRSQPDRVDYAVMSRDKGFVGVVSARLHGDAAFFHFWIGADYQGCGFGGKAARLLMAQLNAININNVLTAIYPDNQRSARTLAALGFIALPLSALPPEENMQFHGLRLHGSSDETAVSELLCQALRRYVHLSNSVFQFAEVPARSLDEHAICI
jgi:RimJ/RimL family protein N-acetyltransferase